MAGSSAQQTAQDVASALVGRHDAVRDHKGTGLDVVCHNAQGNICLMFLLVFLFAERADTV